MADYCTATELKERLFAEGQEGNLAEDDRAASAVTSASRWIDEHCGRSFTAATQTRYFTAEDWNVLEVDDLLSVTSLGADEDGDRTYEITWATTDYDLMPYNAATDGRPYTRIETTPEGVYSFPRGVSKGVKIVGSWGYATTAPAAVKEACLILAARIYKRGDAPFGIVGSPDTGQMRVNEKQDEDVLELLRPYARMF